MSTLNVGSTREPEVASDDVVKDEQYYFEGGDCVIRVENTLFRIHKFILARDSSVFQDMFALPQRATPLEGSADSNPILLRAEKTAHFRALLAVIYALPSDLEKIYAEPLTSEGIDTLCTIISITDKYQFSSIRKWAVGTLYRLLGVDGLPTKRPSWTSTDLARICEAAHLCEHPELEDLVGRVWTEGLMNFEMKPGPAMAIADKYGDKALTGAAYYMQLRQMHIRSQWLEGPIRKKRKVPQKVLEEHLPISAEQKERLLLGHWSLVGVWTRLRSHREKVRQTLFVLQAACKQ